MISYSHRIFYINKLSARCGHVFHRTCIDDWLEHSRTCPNCRLPVPYNNGKVEKLFFNTDEHALESEEVG